jgi:plastocyanin
MRLVGLIGGCAMLLTVPLAGLGGGSVQAAGHAASPKWLTFNAKAKTATLIVIAGYNNVKSGFNFDGYADGKMTVTIPVGYKVTVDFSNKNVTAHSLVIAKYADKLAAKVKPAFSGASTPSPTAGTPKGKSAKFTFVAKPAGTYAMLCTVPGHVLMGMWDVMKVAASGSPSITFAK